MTRMSDETEKLITAMCLWEAVLEVKDETPEIKKTFENVATNSMRYYVAQWVKPVDDAWNELSDEEKHERVPFDWEFVPDWIKARIDWSNAHQPMVMP